MQTVLVRASVLTKVYLANVVVLDVLSNPSDGSRTRRVVEVVELAVFAATVVVHVLTRYLTFLCVVVRASVWSCRFQGSRWRPWHSLVAPRWSSSSSKGVGEVMAMAGLGARRRFEAAALRRNTGDAAAGTKRHGSDGQSRRRGAGGRRGTRRDGLNLLLMALVAMGRGSRGQRQGAVEVRAQRVSGG